MPTADPSTRAVEHGTDPRLLQIARQLTSAADRPVAVGVRLGADDTTVDLLALDPDDPVVGLLGFDAPRSWDAFGVTVSGHTVPLPAAGGARPAPAALPHRTTLALTHLVDRHGASLSLLRPTDGEELVVTHGEKGGPRGRVADACRRVLGLPTPPPERSVDELWSTVWLDRVASWTLADPTTPPSWEVVASLHPAVACLLELDATLLDRPAGSLDALGRAVATTWSWAEVRRRYVDEGLDETIPPEIAAWMDDGMFSRWLLSELPELGELRATLAELLPTQMVDRIDDTLRAWGVGG